MNKELEEWRALVAEARKALKELDK